MSEKLFKDIIYELRKKKQLTQEQLADTLNVSNKTVSKWERGISYPDILLIPKIAKVLDVSINELFDTVDIKNESTATYDNGILIKYKNQAILSILLFIFSFIFPTLAWLFQNIVLIYISCFIGITMIIFSIINLVLASEKFYDNILEKYYNEKYINYVKNFIAVYCLIWYIPLTILPVFLNKGIDIIVLTLVYVVFAIITLLIIKRYKLQLHKKNLVFLIISVICFTTGLICMIKIKILPYMIFYIISQLLNYITLFLIDKFKKLL